MPASRMHQEERPFAATRLNGRHRGLRAGRGLLTENTGEMLNRCSLKDCRQRKFLTQLFLDEGEQTYGQQRVSSQLKKIVSHADRSNVQNLLADVTLRAEILSYSRSRGLFAGVSLEGSTLRPDNDGNERLYGKGTTAKDIVINSAIRPPASAKLVLATLNKKSPRNMSDM